MQNEFMNKANELLREHSGCILVTKKDDLLYQKCIGYADYSNQIPVDEVTQFLVGSVTKQFTAVALLKALSDRMDQQHPVEFKSQMNAALNRSVASYLPAEHVIWRDFMPEWASEVTLHQLLIHSSGIPNYTSLPDFAQQKFPANTDLVSFFKTHPLEFKPGEKFSYTNSGYFLLGIIIEEISQQKLDVYLENNFFQPLEMLSTFLPIRGTVDDLKRSDTRFQTLARGYEYEIHQSEAALTEVGRYEPMEVPGAAGSLVSTATDLLKWNNALYAGKVVPPVLLELMLQPYLITERIDAHYGYGIEILKSATLGEYYSHRGGISGYRSILTYIPALKLTVVTLQNIVSQQEELLPEIEAVKSQFANTMPPDEVMQRLVEIIEDKYPSIIENRKRFEFGPIYDEIIKYLENEIPPI